MSSKNDYYFKDHPKTCDPDDFWGQVKRTINGKPITQEQIDLIVQLISDGLQIEHNDQLLDLCCGNGALTVLISKNSAACVGVDMSETLINIANKNFAKAGKLSFELSDVCQYVRRQPTPNQFTKALCFGSFQYLPHDVAKELLNSLRTRFANIQKFFIGELPNKDCSDAFFKDKNYPPADLDSHATPIGIWRSPDEMIQLAKSTGWNADIRLKPSRYYAAHYRYDVLLTPA